jgi:REP element-mobilizing transposase RayT
MSGDYLITLCTHQRRHTLGRIENGHLAPSPLGGVVSETWHEALWHYDTVRSEALVVMPNHIHAVVEVSADANVRHGPGGLGVFVAAFKCRSGRYGSDIGVDGSIWQRCYHDRILRDAEAFGNAVGYVLDNPSNWNRDPHNRSSDAIQGAGIAPAP